MKSDLVESVHLSLMYYLLMKGVKAAFPCYVLSTVTAEMKR